MVGTGTDLDNLNDPRCTVLGSVFRRSTTSLSKPSLDVMMVPIMNIDIDKSWIARAIDV
ncbi:hypothetical protein PC128_g8605 [Phytophthora cactorum]|nr:hypothetical protein PC128_g8605 [Phytophthora cactorum]